MLVRNLSLTSALTLVGLGLFAHVVVDLVGVEHGGAFAGGGPGMSLVPPSPDAKEQRRRNHGADPRPDRPAMALGSGCVEAPPLEWFELIRELPDCTLDCSRFFCQLNIAVVEDEGSLDINGDGLLDFARGPFTELISNGQIQPLSCILSVSESVNAGGQVSFVERCGLRSDAFLAIVLAQGSLPEHAAVNAEGWRDLDADGDLDLVVVLTTRNEQGFAGRAFWLENTGFEATQPLTGDLNSDGAVNSTDLALLLGGWTGS